MERNQRWRRRSFACLFRKLGRDAGVAELTKLGVAAGVWSYEPISGGGISASRGPGACRKPRHEQHQYPKQGSFQSLLAPRHHTSIHPRNNIVYPKPRIRGSQIHFNAGASPTQADPARHGCPLGRPHYLVSPRPPFKPNHPGKYIDAGPAPTTLGPNSHRRYMQARGRHGFDNQRSEPVSASRLFHPPANSRLQTQR